MFEDFTGVFFFMISISYKRDFATTLIETLHSLHHFILTFNFIFIILLHLKNWLLYLYNYLFL